MSAVLLTLGPGYAVLCGDTMFCLDTGEKTTISKIKMVENKFLYGFTGRNTSAIEFFSNKIDDNFNPTKELLSLSFKELINILDNQFKNFEMSIIPPDFDVCSILCGEIDNNLFGIRYTISSKEISKEIIKQPDTGLKIVGSMYKEHLNNYKLNISEYDIIEAIIEAFQQLLNQGIKIDKTINNIMEAYFINKGIITGYITQKLK